MKYFETRIIYSCFDKSNAISESAYNWENRVKVVLICQGTDSANKLVNFELFLNSSRLFLSNAIIKWRFIFLHLPIKADAPEATRDVVS